MSKLITLIPRLIRLWVELFDAIANLIYEI